MQRHAPAERSSPVPGESGFYTRPRSLRSFSRPKSSSQLGEYGTHKSFPDAGEQTGYVAYGQHDDNAFVVSDGPDSPLDNQNSFASRASLPDEPDSPESHQQLTPGGSAELVRLNAIGGLRNVVPSNDSEELASQQSEAHQQQHHHQSHAVSADVARDRVPDYPLGGWAKESQRAITPKGSRDSHTSYASMRSTDPSSSDVDDSASSHTVHGHSEAVSTLPSWFYPGVS